jgi:hypothetical protein
VLLQCITMKTLAFSRDELTSGLFAFSAMKFDPTRNMSLLLDLILICTLFLFVQPVQESDTQANQPNMPSGVATVNGVRCLGDTATNNDVVGLLKGKIKTGYATASRTEVPLWRLYNAVQTNGGWSEVC